MFGLARKKKQSGFDNKNLSEILGLLSMVIGISALGHETPRFQNMNRENLKRAMVDELQQLKADHWDKDAFDRLTERVRQF